MKILHTGGEPFHLPSGLNAFQEELYIHLVRWKWEHLTREPGFYRGRAYDALLPEHLRAQLHPVYAPVRGRFLEHQRRFPFKSHKFLGHMASSQAACASLFLPLMEDPAAGAEVLRAVKPDLAAIAVECLDRGFRIEFWDEPDNILNDHRRRPGLVTT